MTSTRIHEVAFCAEVSKWADLYFARNDSPFSSSGIEGFGTGALKNKRRDLRFDDRMTGRVAITGEVKLPGAPKGDSPYNETVVQDAAQKADNAGVQYFFTWNVNTFVLWDRKKWDVPLLERRVREWPLGRHLRNSGEVERSENLEFIRTKFLPVLLRDIGQIYRGQQPDWPMAPDDIFIRSLETHLAWPIDATRALLAERSTLKAFDAKLQEWMTTQGLAFVRNNPDQWSEALNRASQTLVHVLANRLIFYQALRARFSKLPQLRFRGVKTAADAYAYLQRVFDNATRVSGDYEPILFPNEQDWAGRLVFEGLGALTAWQAALVGIEHYDFSEISSDIVGRVFQRLVSPEERHRWGQHFTGDDVVDLINSFCIRAADGAVLDPACGSGSFLVRAYYRKRSLKPQKPHLELISELFGSDIALYPAHLATLNIAAREINGEANYPRITRRDFFDIDPEKPFCELPPDHTPIPLPTLTAVIGNPPYVRQEKFVGAQKDKLAKLLSSRARGLRLSGRSDIHCYFWPAAAFFLREGGYFGFLTSSSWLDVEYGFALQKWILQNFRLVAILESTAEPWFPDARVKTCATILEKCTDPAARMATLVKFVRVKRPLAEIINCGSDELDARFRAVDILRDRIEQTTADFEDDSIRIIVKPQQDLWNEGLRASRILAGAPVDDEGDDNESEVGTECAAKSVSGDRKGASNISALDDYGAGKWGRYLRAPDFYFDVMREFGARFVPLGEIVTVRFGVKSGCDDFFMPRDITVEALEQCPDQRDFKKRYGLDRAPVADGKVKIVRAGDASVHPIEAKYLEPEVHSLMNLDRPTVRSAEIDRVVLLVGDQLSAIKGSLVANYLHFGEKTTFASGKSSAVPVPKRSTCASREPWYDLTKYVKPGFGFWPKAQQYRHIIADNPDRVVCNCNLYDLSYKAIQTEDESLLVALLNSTLIALFKTFYGRYAGTEGNLKTEVVDVNLIEIPDPRGADPNVAQRILLAFARLAQRPTGRMVEEQLMECHSPDKAAAIAAGPLVLPEELRQPDRRDLDDAVLELLGAADPKRRIELVDRLYAATADHFRQIRVVEIQKMEQRSKSKTARLTAEELAADAWDGVFFKDEPALSEWLGSNGIPSVVIHIPNEGTPRVLDDQAMFDRETVFFGKDKTAARVVCASRAQALLVKRMAELDLRGDRSLPNADAACRQLLDELNSRVEAATVEFDTLASSRVSEPKVQSEIVALLLRWLIHGKPSPGPRHAPDSGQPTPDPDI